MNCNENKRYLTAYLDGETDAGLTESIECHLQTCLSCRVEKERLQGLNQWLDDDFVPAVTDPYFLARVRSRLQSQSVHLRAPSFKPRTLAPATVAVGLLLGVTFGSQMGEMIMPGNEPETEITAVSDYWSDDQSLSAFYDENVDEWSNGVGGNDE